MKDYDVYFEIFGKKMKTTVSAVSEQAAKSIVSGKIIFHKVEEKNDIFDELFNIFKK